jgi:chemotaxis signal transduction protein
VRYAIPVDAAVAVRLSDGMVTLPGHRSDADRSDAERSDVVGVLPGNPVLSVISPLDASGDARHILVVTTPEHDFGVLVDAVTDVTRFEDDKLQPAPPGRHHGLIAGVAERADGIVLIADPDALAARL